MSIITFFVQNENLNTLFRLNVAYLQGYKNMLAAKKSFIYRHLIDCNNCKHIIIFSFPKYFHFHSGMQYTLIQLLTAMAF